jgi:type III secretion system low calcium response chaperone LcrH/SycD
MESQFDYILRQHFTNNLTGKSVLLDSFPDLNVSHLEAVYGIGLELFKQRKYDKAEDLFYCIATMNHFEQRYWKALAITLMVQKKYQDALTIYLAAYFLDPMDIEVTSAMADCCMSLGDKKGTEEFLRQTCDIFEEEKKREDLAQRAKGLLEIIQRKGKNYDKSNGSGSI